MNDESGSLADVRTFAVMWNCQGLEAVEEMPNPALITWWRLSNQEPRDVIPNLQHWELRARFNPQRNYEIYLVATGADVDQQVIRDLFERDPQVAADLIRARGQCFYSDRGIQQPVIT